MDPAAMLPQRGEGQKEAINQVGHVLEGNDYFNYLILCIAYFDMAAVIDVLVQTTCVAYIHLSSYI